jgi:hypothetical protein
VGLATPLLSGRDLNRALLARQHLLARATASPTEMIERLVGLQAQQARPPFVGLWSRLSHFAAADLRAEILVRLCRAGDASALDSPPFAPPDAQDREALAAEGEDVLRFLEPAATGFDIQFAA